MTQQPIKQPSLPSRKFYFLDYFFILLSSVEKHRFRSDIFNAFKILKQKYRLGESKYKKLTAVENPTQHQQNRYRYTFNKVVDECKEYGLIQDKKDLQQLFLTISGEQLLQTHRSSGGYVFNLKLFELMETTHLAFRTLVNFLYKANPKGSGVLIFPHYSPSELKLKRSNVKTAEDIIQYSRMLVRRLQSDIKQYLQNDVNLEKENIKILNKLTDEKLLPADASEVFAPRDYNKITKRIRDFWLMYFLQEVYKCPFSMNSFDVWGYRAKQIGIVQVTESYPHINGKLVYPTSVVIDNVCSDDFSKVYQYDDKQNLFIHKPLLGAQEENRYKKLFIDTLVTGYFSLRRHSRYYFINLISLREIVCLQLKISMITFEETLNEIYRLNLAGQLKIRISLEVDKLPEETNVMYLKRDPVMVDGSYRNIIAIDVTKE